MTSHQMNPSDWSLDLQQQTRDAIDEMRCDPNGLLHFKHKLYGYATAEISDFVVGQFRLAHINQKTIYDFLSCNNLIECGWRID